MSLTLGYSPNFLHAATPDEIHAVTSLSLEQAQFQTDVLARIHDVVTACTIVDAPNGDAAHTMSVGRIANMLGIELVHEPIPGQQLLLRPIVIGGLSGAALWRQRIGTTRSPRGRWPMFKAERLG